VSARGEEATTSTCGDGTAREGPVYDEGHSSGVKVCAAIFQMSSADRRHTERVERAQPDSGVAVLR
jgi:hypothetical protein